MCCWPSRRSDVAKFYEKDDLLSKSLEQVLADALVFEEANDSVLATRDR